MTFKPLYTPNDWQRPFPEKATNNPWRDDSSRDYGRIIHSACFRRLQGKTQVFPTHESDFFRNRLTHSLEVSQIAQGIAARLNHEVSELQDDPIIIRLCDIAGLVHDLGHPPFGHNGERALDAQMKPYGGFEGNAQTLRILTTIEKKILVDNKPQAPIRAGLNLTYRSLASALKYNRVIPSERTQSDKFVKGYYETDAELVKNLKAAVLGREVDENEPFKTVECSIMDLADDIAYSTYDLEDALKAGFLTPLSILSSENMLLDKVARKVSEEVGHSIGRATIIKTFVEIFGLAQEGSEKTAIEQLVEGYKTSRNISERADLRLALSSQLVNEFIGSVRFRYNKKDPALSEAFLKEKAFLKVEILKQYVYQATIFSARVKLGEYRGDDIVTTIFKALDNEKADVLMPEDVRALCHNASDRDRKRAICDYIAGMTDRYAIEFFGRLHSDNPQSMFKPIQ